MHPTSFFVRLGSAAAAVLLAAGSAAAQSAAPEFDSYRIPGWSFTPEIGIGVFHDSNVNLAIPQFDIGETQSDTLIDIVPSGQLEFNGRRTTLAARYTGAFHRYAEIEGLDTFSQRASVAFNRAMTKRVSIFARQGFSATPTTDDVEIQGVPYSRTGSRTSSLATGTSIRLTKLTSVSGRYELTWVDFDEDEGELPLAGGWLHVLTGDASRQFSDRLTLGGEYAFRTASIEDPTQETGLDPRRDFQFHNAGGILSYQLGPYTALSAGGGLAVLLDRALDATRTGPYVRAGLTHSVEVVVLGVTFDRQQLPTFGFGGSNTSQELRAFVQMPIARQRLYVRGSASWRHSDPYEPDSPVFDTISFRSTLGYAVARWARVEGHYTYTQQDSFGFGGEVIRHRVGVQLVVAQPVRIH